MLKVNAISDSERLGKRQMGHGTMQTGAPLAATSMPAVSQPIAKSPDDVDLWHADLTAQTAAAPQWARCLAEGEWKRAAGFRFEQDRARFIVARALLRDVLGRYAGRPADQIPISAGPLGKPCTPLQLHGRQIEFNLSHSGDQVLIGVALGRCVGVDIETVPDEPQALEFIDGQLSPLERAGLLALPMSERPLARRRIWVCKEAYLKALGLGLSVPLDSFSVETDPSMPAALIHPAQVARGREWQIRSLSLEGSQLCTGCAFVEGGGSLRWRLWSWRPAAMPDMETPGRV